MLTLDYPHRKLLLSDQVLASGRSPGVQPMLIEDTIPVADLAAGGATIRAAVDSGGLGLSLARSL
jgi:hypothetical protein